MRKFISIATVGALTLTLTGCVPSGNIVGNATFTTIYSSGIANPGDIATIGINGGIVATPNALRLRLTKANFSVGSFNLTATKFIEVINEPTSRFQFASSRLKGKNSCGYAAGVTSDGKHFELGLFSPSADVLNDINAETGLSIPLGSQILGFYGSDSDYSYFSWFGSAPANSLKVGGRNLCGGNGG